MLDRRGVGVYNIKVLSKVSQKPSFHSVEAAMLPVAGRVRIRDVSFTTDKRLVCPTAVEVSSTTIRRGYVT